MAAASTTLQDIRNKMRRITGSPSEDQLSDNDCDQYINTFINSDFGCLLKLFSLRTILTFYTQPGVDVYKTITDPTQSTNPLFDFNNKYTAIHPPVFIAGVQSFFTQERDVFYGNFPQTNFVQMSGLYGNGTTGPFTGTLPPPLTATSNSFTQIPHILQNSVLISCLDTNGTAMNLVDAPINNQTGNLVLPNSVISMGTVNYLTGAFTVTFPNNTAVTSPVQANPIWTEAIYYAAGLPTTMLFYDNYFTLRPVPDKAYIVQVEANIVPTQLLADGTSPTISQWWQYIAMGASIKVFQDRMDYDSADRITPEFLNQQSLVNSTSMDQYTNQRTVTIYTNNGIANAWNNFGRWPY